MSAVIEKIIAEALELPISERAFLAEKLLESLETDDLPGLSPKWQEEVRRRCEELDHRAVELRDAESVFAKARQSLR